MTPEDLAIKIAVLETYAGEILKDVARIADALETLASTVQPQPKLTIQPERPRCPICQGTGRVESETVPYCSCAVGRDLLRLEINNKARGSFNPGA